MDNPMQMLNAFMQFRNNYQGNARQEVEKLLASGQMSQTQLNQLQGMARQIQAFANNMGMRL